MQKYSHLHQRLTALPLPCILALGFLGTSVAHAAGETPFTFHATNILGTSMDLHVAALTQEDANLIHAAVMAEIETLRKTLSTYDAASDLGRVNASLKPVKVSPDVIAVLKLYEQWHEKSNGAFSGKIGGLVAIWKAAESKSAMPQKAALDAEVAQTAAPLWTIDETAQTVQRLSDRPINIDSLGKGFIVSKAVAAAKSAAPGVRGIMLNIGGDISTWGSSSKTTTAPWTVDIADPAHPAENAAPLVSIKVPGLSVATSGNYDRGYQIGATKLSHILDPRNGYPVDAADAPGGKRNPLVASATVIARDNAAANALAASLMVLTPEQGLALITATPGTEALIVLSDGKQIRSPGFNSYVTVSPAVVGQPWANGAQVSFTVQQTITARERPYVAIWVENIKGEHVATLAEWGTRDKYITSLSSWIRATGYNDELIRTVSRATRPAGKYSFTWDGKDQAGKPVPAGDYKINVEFAFEHSGHSIASASIACGNQDAQSLILHTRHFGDVDLTFTAKGK